MKINNEPISKYGATLLTFDIQAAQDETAVEWVDKAILPTSGDTTATFGSATAVLYFRGTTLDEIVRNIAQVLQQVKDEALLKVPGYRGEYVAYLVSSQIDKVQRSKTRRKLTLTFKGYLRGEKQHREFWGVTTAKLKRVGARPAPVILTISPEMDMDAFTVTGLTETPIVISNLTAAVTVTIDGRDGTAWENGVSKNADVDLWEPPALREPETTLEFSRADAKVTVEYLPVWL